MLIIRYVIWLFYCLHDFIAIDQLKIEISEGSARAVVAYVKLVKMNFIRCEVSFDSRLSLMQYCRK